MTTTDLHWMDASEMARRFRNKSLSPVEATEACIARIEARDGDLNAFCLDRGKKLITEMEPGGGSSHSTGLTGITGLITRLILRVMARDIGR